MAQSFAQTLTDARLQAAGIRKNAGQLSRRGVGTEEAERLEALLLEVETLDNEQESLKARLKDTGAGLRAKTAELKAALSTNARIIKADMPQTLWKEFGIQAKK